MVLILLYVGRQLIFLLKNSKKPLSGSKIIVIGLLYKQDVDYTLGSHALNITEETFKKSFTVIIVTNHIEIDYSLFAEHAQLLIDTRDAMPPFSVKCEVDFSRDYREGSYS